MLCRRDPKPARPDARRSGARYGDHQRCGTSHPPILIVLLIVLGTLPTSGCGKNDALLAPVTGVVTIDGKPYPGGKVIFSPVSSDDDLIAGRPSFGITDASGRFQLNCYEEGDGAVIGEHSVTLFRAEDHDRTRPDLRQYRFSRVSLPTGHIAIDPGDNRVSISLTSDQLHQHGNRL